MDIGNYYYLSTVRDTACVWYFLGRPGSPDFVEYLAIKIYLKDSLISVEFYSSTEASTGKELYVIITSPKGKFLEGQKKFNQNSSKRERLLSTIYEDWGIYVSYNDYKHLFNGSHEDYLTEVVSTVVEIYNKLTGDSLSRYFMILDLRLKENQLLSLIEMIIENNITDDDSGLLFDIRKRIHGFNLSYLADQAIAEYRFNNTSIPRNIRYSDYIVHHIRNHSMSPKDIMIIVNRYLNKEIVVDYDNFEDSLFKQLRSICQYDIQRVVVGDILDVLYGYSSDKLKWIGEILLSLD